MLILETTLLLTTSFSQPLLLLFHPLFPLPPHPLPLHSFSGLQLSPSPLFFLAHHLRAASLATVSFNEISFQKWHKAEKDPSSWLEIRNCLDEHERKREVLTGLVGREERTDRGGMGFWYDIISTWPLQPAVLAFPSINRSTDRPLESNCSSVEKGPIESVPRACFSSRGVSSLGRSKSKIRC